MNTEQSHLVIVDRNEAKRDNLVQRLEQLGYGVATANDERQALKMLTVDRADDAQAQHVDMILLSTELPEADVSQMLEQLKADSTQAHIPVLLLSTTDEVDKVAKYLDLGADDFWLETHNPVLLKTRIEACLIKSSLGSQVPSGLSAKLERDLEIGRKIQTDFLPSKDQLPQVPGWDIAARLHPARQVAGDFYDAFLFARNKIGLFIGDVCDKGVGPAMFMALTRSLLRAFVEQHRPLGWMDTLTGDQSAMSDSKKEARAKRQKILLSSGTSAVLAVELTNNYIGENHGDMNMFATLFFGVLDPGTGVFTYINGGHDAPAIVRPDGSVKMRLKPTGPAVGIFPNATYDIEQITLKPGELLMTFTDGVLDARNPEGKRFTVERLFPLLKEPFASVGDLLDRIEASLYAYIANADQFDDITMLAVRRSSDE